MGRARLFIWGLCAMLLASSAQSATFGPAGVPEPRNDRAPSPPISSSPLPLSQDEAPLLKEVRRTVDFKGEFDWIRTTSGEWLKGTIVSMRESKLVFKSQQFGEKTISWGQVEELHSPKTLIYVLEDRTHYTGTAKLISSTLTIETGRGPIPVEKQSVLSIVPQRRREIGRWAYKLTLGASGRTGNTETIDYVLFSRLTRTGRFTRLNLEYNGAYGLASGVEITHKHRGNGELNWYFSRRFYLTPVLGEAIYDRFQNIRLRSLVGTGAGMHVVDRGPLDVDLESTIGYIHGEQISAPPGVDPDYDEVMVRPRAYMLWSIVKGVKLELDWNSTLVVTDMRRTFHRGSARFTVAVNKTIDFDVSAIFDRLEEPATTEDGTVPQENDLAVILGLGINLD